MAPKGGFFQTGKCCLTFQQLWVWKGPVKMKRRIEMLRRMTTDNSTAVNLHVGICWVGRSPPNFLVWLVGFVQKEPDQKYMLTDPGRAGCSFCRVLWSFATRNSNNVAPDTNRQLRRKSARLLVHGFFNCCDDDDDFQNNHDDCWNWLWCQPFIHTAAAVASNLDLVFPPLLLADDIIAW